MDENDRRILNDVRLSPTAMVVCLRLREWPADTVVVEANLAALVGVNPTTIRAALKQLTDTGWITVDRSRSRGRFTAPYIHVHDEPRHTPPPE